MILVAINTRQNNKESVGQLVETAFGGGELAFEEADESLEKMDFGLTVVIVIVQEIVLP